jgi:putative spermidine/putrescine transport system permease protein
MTFLRPNLPPYAGPLAIVWYYAFRLICVAIFLFLVAPILVIIPLSFNAESFFSFTDGMLALKPSAYSLKWYRDIFANGMLAPDAPFGFSWISDSWQRSQWMLALKNSVMVGVSATIVATALGTLASVGLSRPEMPFRRLITGLLISPMIVPIVITATGIFFFFSQIHLAQTYAGLILAHALLGTPFVVITVTATLASFDRSLTRAAANLGASSWTAFSRVQLPLILPGVISGALFAFVTSFDEVVVVLFIAAPDQRTIPRQMWSGLREQVSPTILAVATILIALSLVLLLSLELTRRRMERLKIDSFQQP